MRLRIGKTQGMTLRISPPSIAPAKAISVASQTPGTPDGAAAATVPASAVTIRPRPGAIRNMPAKGPLPPPAPALVSTRMLSPLRVMVCGAA